MIGNDVQTENVVGDNGEQGKTALHWTSSHQDTTCAQIFIAFDESLLELVSTGGWL